MSQNPYNPYEQNPPDPNAMPGTSYGSPPLPPGQSQGSSYNYGPYTPSPTPPEQNPNYGPYYPYTPNPPTPGPAPNPTYNPYDPYAPTLAGQGTTPDYNPYAPPAPPVPPPTQPRAGGISWKVILSVVLALVLVVGGIAIGLVSYNTTQTNNANATATAVSTHNQLTATAQTHATATAIASTYPFSANLVLSDPLTDNSKGVQWQTSDACKFTGSAYHVLDSQANTYQPCLALNTDYSDFTFQVEMSISKGDGEGLILRGNANKNQFYLFELGAKGDYTVYVAVDTSGANTRTLTSGKLSQALNGTDTFGVVARGSTISFYVNPLQNPEPVATINNSTYTHGQIGVLSYDISNSADVIFTNAKVWVLPPGA
jgi:hypothetical protein